MKWKIDQMSKYAPGYTGPMTTAGPVKPKGPKTLTPGMPTPVKTMPTPRGPRGIGPNDAPIRPKGPKGTTSTPVKPMPPKGTPVKPMPTPRGPRSIDPTRTTPGTPMPTPVKPRGPRGMNPLTKRLLGLSKGGIVKGGMDKKGKK